MFATFTRFSIHAMRKCLLAGAFLILLAACAPTLSEQQLSAEATRPADSAAPTATEKPAMGPLPSRTPAPSATTGPAATPTANSTTAPADAGSGQNAGNILIQLTYEPGFTLPEYSYPFGRTPSFTLLADGRVIYVDENQDSKVMQAQLSQDEAAALLQKVRDMGFARLESHTDMCGMAASGKETCISDAATRVMRVRMEDGSLREIKNYANFSNYPVTYEAIYNLLNDYTHPKSAIYTPPASASGAAATLFIRIAPRPGEGSPADWPLDPAYVKRAQSAPDQATAVALSGEEAALWQKNVGIDNTTIAFQLNGQPVSAIFVPWLPGDDFSQAIEEAFPAK